MKEYIAFRVDRKTYNLVTRTARAERRMISSMVRNIVDAWAERRLADEAPARKPATQENIVTA